MFIYTLKASKIKFFSVLFIAVASLLVLITLVPDGKALGTVAAVTTDYTGIETEDDRISFIKSFGYEVGGLESTSEVIIPEAFDAVYTKYNDIQRAQGLNLKKYANKSVTRYTYYITNYPDCDGKVLLTLLVYKNRIIGGDISCADGNGFVRGFEG